MKVNILKLIYIIIMRTSPPLEKKKNYITVINKWKCFSNFLVNFVATFVSRSSYNQSFQFMHVTKNRFLKISRQYNYHKETSYYYEYLFINSVTSHLKTQNLQQCEIHTCQPKNRLRIRNQWSKIRGNQWKPEWMASLT